MKQFKGTKGEWSFEKANDRTGLNYVKIRGGEKSIGFAGTYLDVGRIPEETALANAQLIAAAPELLEALQGLLKSSFPRYTGEFCEKDSKHPADIAFKAINKALGE